MVAMCVCATAVGADEDAGYGERVIRLQNGLNWVDLNGDGREDLVVGARWRGGVTGRHSDSHHFLVAGQNVGDGDPEWYGVTGAHFGSGSDDECRQYEARLVAQNSETGAGYVVIDARRDPGGSYYDSEAVEFSFCRVVNVAPVGADRPAFRFILNNQVESDATYCDIGEAFQSELGLE